MTALQLQNFPNAVLISSSTGIYNCHSFAWFYQSNTSPYWMDNPTAYWTDGSFTDEKATLLSKDDRVTYTTTQLDHSAYVFQGGTAKVTGLVISKWGATPLFKHAQNYCPYTMDPINKICKAVTFRYYKPNRTLKETEGISPFNMEEASTMTIYPNPSNGVFMLSWPGNMDVNNITIHDIMSREIYSSMELYSPLKLDISRQPAGIYLLNSIINNEKKSFKIIVK